MRLVFGFGVESFVGALRFQGKSCESHGACVAFKFQNMRLWGLKVTNTHPQGDVYCGNTKGVRFSQVQLRKGDPKIRGKKGTSGAIPVNPKPSW